MRGDGFFKSMEEGGEGVLTGRIAESIAARMGMAPGAASTVAAAATPYVVSFLREKLGGTHATLNTQSKKSRSEERLLHARN